VKQIVELLGDLLALRKERVKMAPPAAKAVAVESAKAAVAEIPAVEIGQAWSSDMLEDVAGDSSEPPEADAPSDSSTTDSGEMEEPQP
jgi:hypothetical protein